MAERGVRAALGWTRRPRGYPLIPLGGPGITILYMLKRILPLVLAGCLRLTAQPADVLYDEAKVPKFTLPEVLALRSGSACATPRVGAAGAVRRFWRCTRRKSSARVRQKRRSSTTK